MSLPVAISGLLRDLLAPFQSRRSRLAGVPQYLHNFSGVATHIPTPLQRQSDLLAFYDHFENLVEVLCDAANYGPNDRLERTFQIERAWMESHYCEVRPFVIAYLRTDLTDAAQGIATSGKGADAIQALWVADSLATFLSHDDGMMISRITRGREAINFYAHHLKKLVSA